MTSTQETAELSNCSNGNLFSSPAIKSSTVPLQTFSSKTPVGLALIWYDENIILEDDPTSQLIEQLRRINDSIIFCTTEQQCHDSIRTVINEKIFLIIHGEIASHILHECEQIDQIDSIFGYHPRPENYQHFLKHYSKLVGIYSAQDALLLALKTNLNSFERQFAAFRLFQNPSEKSIRNLSAESASFLWFQLFKDLLERLPHNAHSKEELINFSRQYYHDNEREFQCIDEFERNYTTQTAIE